MLLIEIIVGLLAILVVVLVFGNYIYKKIKHIPTGECASCKSRGSKLVEEYYKKYK